MARPTVAGLAAFLAIAHERSFTRAAARLGVSQSALSHTLRGPESRLGLRLLNRTTRSVSPTEAGARLLQRIGPHFVEIENELAALGELRDRPAGTIRITATDYAADTILLPRLAQFLPRYPDVRVEISVDDRLVDIVADGFDAGVRDGESVAKDMIATRIGPDLRMAVVGSPAYFARRSAPRKPRDLTRHARINLRLPTRGGMYAWEFQRGRRKVERARRRPARVQSTGADARRRADRIGPCLPAGRRGASASCRGWAQARARGLVPTLCRLSPVLREPSPTVTRVRAAGRRIALPRLTHPERPLEPGCGQRAEARVPGNTIRLRDAGEQPRWSPHGSVR